MNVEEIKKMNADAKKALAGKLRISTKTLQLWTQGKRKPSPVMIRRLARYKRGYK